MNIKATNKYLSEKVGTTVFSCQPHDLLILYMTDQNCEIRAVFNPATFLFGPQQISLSVSEIHPIAVLFHVTVTLRTRSGAK